MSCCGLEACEELVKGWEESYSERNLYLNIHAGINPLGGERKHRWLVLPEREGQNFLLIF